MFTIHKVLHILTRTIIYQPRTSRLLATIHASHAPRVSTACSTRRRPSTARPTTSVQMARSRRYRVITVPTPTPPCPGSSGRTSVNTVRRVGGFYICVCVMSSPMLYSVTCLDRPPLLHRESSLSRQVACHRRMDLI